MAWTIIEKSRRDQATAPNLRDYDQARRTFSWKEARKELDGLPAGQGLNIAYEAVDRHARDSRRDHLAMRWLGKNGETQDYTYDRLQELTNRFANVLQDLGVQKGDRAFSLAGRVPELYVAALGTLKHRSIFCPLFSAFGPEPIRARLTIGGAKVLVTTESLYERKVKAIRSSLPCLEHVLLIGEAIMDSRPKKKQIEVLDIRAAEVIVDEQSGVLYITHAHAIAGWADEHSYPCPHPNVLGARLHEAEGTDRKILRDKSAPEGSALAVLLGRQNNIRMVGFFVPGDTK